VKFEWSVDSLAPFPPPLPPVLRGFYVQRSETEDHRDFRTVSPGFAQSPFYDVLASGTWYYRLAQEVDRGTYYSLIAITAYSENFRITVP